MGLGLGLGLGLAPPSPHLGDARGVEAEEAVVEERGEVLGHLLALLQGLGLRLGLGLGLGGRG